jgi:hypothetical protein
MTEAPPPPPAPGDGWYESEESTRRGMVSELQRIRRRMAVRPIPVLLVATLLTSAIIYKVATKPTLLECEVVLALTEGAMASGHTSIPVDQLRAYVTSVLLPDNKLMELIEKRDLFRLRKKLGNEFALEQLRGSLEVQIWKNGFTTYDEDDSNAMKSARIGLTVSDTDPDRGFALARDLAGIVIETLAVQRQKLASEVEQQVQVLRKVTSDKLARLQDEISRTQAAIDDAITQDRPELVGILRIDLATLEHDRAGIELQLVHIATSPESLAQEITAAGLDMSLSIVEERRPERPTRSSFVLVLIAMVVGSGALTGAALVLGAFDSRIHDADDVVRLGLPVLGHVPGFAGDNVGSMQTRSAARARVPSFLRWRSHR